MTDSTPLHSWQLHAIRNKAGVHTCELTDQHGTRVIEPLHDCAASSQSRLWANPPNEIAHIREYSEFLKVRKVAQQPCP